MDKDQKMAEESRGRGPREKAEKTHPRARPTCRKGINRRLQNQRRPPFGAGHLVQEEKSW